jgi:adenylate cyclase
MDRIWQWAWDRYASHYTWAVFLISFVVSLPVHLFWAFLVLANEGSSAYVRAGAISVGLLVALVFVVAPPGASGIRIVERWAAGSDVDPAQALTASFAWTRRAAVRQVVAATISFGILSALVAALAGTSQSRIIQYAILGGAIGVALQVISLHGLREAVARPARLALAGDTSIGDTLPRSRPTFAAWMSSALLGVIFVFSVDGAMLASAYAGVAMEPLWFLAMGGAMTLALGLPITVGLIFAPILRPIRELAAGTERVAAADYGQRVPVIQDDDLGALAASFNRMQAGLAERQRLHSAFGTYVDPTLAARLLDQGDDVFTGERREVTVMFIDIRDFTPFAEANTAEDTVARLNALFDVVVPVVVGAGGHVNKFLGDGALAVFGAPNELAHHADAALAAAALIHRRVVARFGGEVSIGIGINTGVVIAGTIGGGGKLEFTLIGDAVNVAARIEQLTKTTGDAILLTGETAQALSEGTRVLIDKGMHELKGKSAAVRVFSLDPAGAPSRRSAAEHV